MISVNPPTGLLPVVAQVFPAGTKLTVAPCRSAYTVLIRDESFIVKPLRVGAGRANLIGKLLSENRACPVLPRLVKPEGCGHYWWHGGNRYLVTRRLPGREADYRQSSDLSAAIATMAEFHRYTRQFTQTLKQGWALLVYEPEREWERYLNEMETCRRLAVRASDPWSRQYLRVWHYFSNQAWLALQAVRARNVPEVKVICYHDWAWHNLIRYGNQAYLVDFDYMLIDLPAHDRANLIARYLRLYDWSREALLKLLWLFDRFYPWRCGELSLLRVYLLFPYDYWILGRQYYLEKQPWSAKYFQDQWQRKIEPYLKREKILDLLERI
jgi:CotS family spore coat protein